MTGAHVVITAAGQVKDIIIDGHSIAGVIFANGTQLVMSHRDQPQLAVLIEVGSVTVAPEAVSRL